MQLIMIFCNLDANLQRKELNAKKSLKKVVSLSKNNVTFVAIRLNKIRGNNVTPNK